MAGVTEGAPSYCRNAPQSLVDEELVKLIYSQFFPQEG